MQQENGADGVEEPPSLFFSYAHADRDCAQSLILALEEQGFTVWWDDRLQGGTAYADRIESALEAAAAVIVLWSPASTRSHWVRDEAEQGRRRGVLVPLVVGGAQPPIGFRQFQVIDVEGWRGDRGDQLFTRILAAIERREPVPAEAPAPARPAAPGRGGLDRRTLFRAGGAMAGIAVLAALGMAFWPSKAAAGIAVLPFRNLTGDPQKDYLSAGLSEELRAMLARNRALRVVARTSCEAIAERGLEADEMARALAVSHILDGTLRRTASGLAIAIELIDGASGFAEWTENYEGSPSEMLAVQHGIVEAVTQALTEVDDSSEGRYGATENAAAFDAYLQGNSLYLSAENIETDRAALAQYDRAIALDPDFGAAQAARARTLTVLGNKSEDVRTAREYYALAAGAAREAVAAGPNSADAHSTLGMVLFQAQLKVAEARAPFDRSYELGTGDAAVTARFANYAAQTGRHDLAAGASATARSLDPLNPTIIRSFGFVAYAAGRYEEANAAVREALRLNPSLGDSHARIGMGLILLGRPQEAIEAARQESFALVREPCLAIAYDMLGNGEAARQAMTALVKQYGNAGLYQQAQVLSAWGQADAAMNALDRAFELGDSGLTYLYVDPFLDPLRERADFERLLKRMGYV